MSSSLSSSLLSTRACAGLIAKSKVSRGAWSDWACRLGRGARCSDASPPGSCACAQVQCLQRADEGYMDRVNMYSSFYVATRKPSALRAA